MIVVGKKRVLDFMQKYNQSRRVMQSWVQLVEAATWSSLQNLKETCPTADLIKGTNLVVFDIRGDKYRIIARVDYSEQEVQIRHVFTHEHYEEWLRD